jgi:hypothetical protein
MQGSPRRPRYAVRREQDLSVNAHIDTFERPPTRMAANEQDVIGRVPILRPHNRLEQAAQTIHNQDYQRRPGHKQTARRQNKVVLHFNHNQRGVRRATQ